MSSVNYSASVTAAATQAGISPALALAVMNQESGGNPSAVSSAGAVGLFQLMPSSFPGVNINDPTTNIDTGVGYLAQLLNQYNGNVALALAAYNAGPGNVASYGNTIPPFAETQNYVASILGVLGLTSQYNADGSFATSVASPGDVLGSISDAVSNIDFTDPTTLAVIAGVVVVGAVVVTQMV